MALRLALDILDSPRGRPLALQLAADAPALSRHPVGNYVVQHLLSRPAGDTWREEVFAEVVCGLRGSFVELSKQKYSSNVVERAVADSAVAGRREVFEELLRVSWNLCAPENHAGHPSRGTEKSRYGGAKERVHARDAGKLSFSQVEADHESVCMSASRCLTQSSFTVCLLPITAVDMPHSSFHIPTLSVNNVARELYSP